jgi:membrane fusion protein (multidrug efflux system)
MLEKGVTMLDKTREQQQDVDGKKAEAAEPRRTERSQRDQPAAPDEEQQSDDKGQDDQNRQADQKLKGGQKSKSGGILATIKAHPWVTGFVLLALAIAALAGLFFWMYESQFESTDDAFIDTRVVIVSPEVVGNITDVPVTDNQIVHAGDLLARIDQRDYTAAVAQAEAQIAQATAAIEASKAQEEAQRAQVQQAEHQITVAQAQFNFSRDENDRYQQEVQTGAGTRQRAQQTASDLEAKRAALFAAQDTRDVAARQIAVIQAQQKSAEAQREAAQAQRATAEANLSRTELHASVDGRVTRLTGAVGQLAIQGAALMVLVPLDIWITANYKETQLYDIRVGQPVDIEVDAYGRSFPGRVDSVQAGSGTAFSLLPAENATGNYVKVVQRIPVKLTFQKPPEVELGPGMSVMPTVRVRPPCALCRMWGGLPIWRNRSPG